MSNKRPDKIDINYLKALLDMLIPSKRKIILLEGSTDIDFLKILTDKSEKDILFIDANGKPNIEQLFIDITELQNNQYILGVVDKDFGDIFEKKYEWDNILQTDFTSIEYYYIYYSGFYSFAREILSKEGINKFLGFQPSLDLDRFKSFLHTSLKALTKLRVLCFKNGYHIPINNIFSTYKDKQRKFVDSNNRYKKFKNIFDPKLFILDVNLLLTNIRTSKEYTEKCSCLDFEKVKEEYNLFEIDESLILTNGHDLISYITCLYNKYSNSNTKGDRDIEEIMRCSITEEMFDEYECTKQIRQWILN
ncbi:DUF4435 domain-containing protein [Ruminiclostridium papyrosolvens DSM 2782]|nr:DUF4435 domain-containing protein [Ruminiclostridium papyrosolvens]WES34906.1 DUF4435 domain-containing protein [Ruminiclostridium papyrosolvens DSM 2782]